MTEADEPIDNIEEPAIQGAPEKKPKKAQLASPGDEGQSDAESRNKYSDD